MYKVYVFAQYINTINVEQKLLCPVLFLYILFFMCLPNITFYSKAGNP